MEDCESAAGALGLSDTTAQAVSTGLLQERPPYCYYKASNPINDRLWFNSAFDSTVICSSERNCLCKSGRQLQKVGQHGIGKLHLPAARRTPLITVYPIATRGRPGEEFRAHEGFSVQGLDSIEKNRKWHPTLHVILLIKKAPQIPFHTCVLFKKAFGCHFRCHFRCDFFQLNRVHVFLCTVNIPVHSS